MTELAEFLRRGSHSGHPQSQITIQLMSDQTPKAADLLNIIDDEIHVAAHLPETVRRISKVIMRLFMETEGERCSKDKDAVLLEYARHLGNQLERVRRMLQYLNIQHGVERFIAEGEAMAIVKAIRTRRAEFRRRAGKRLCVLHPEISTDVRSEDVFKLFVPTPHVEQ